MSRLTLLSLIALLAVGAGAARADVLGQPAGPYAGVDIPRICRPISEALLGVERPEAAFIAPGEREPPDAVLSSAKQPVPADRNGDSGGARAEIDSPLLSSATADCFIEDDVGLSCSLLASTEELNLAPDAWPAELDLEGTIADLTSELGSGEAQLAFHRPKAVRARASLVGPLLERSCLCFLAFGGVALLRRRWRAGV